MKINNISTLLTIAALAGLSACSPRQAAMRNYVQDDLYSSQADVKAVTYDDRENKELARTTETEEGTTRHEQARPRTGVRPGVQDEYYNQDQAAAYQQQDAYEQGYQDALRNNDWSNWGNNRNQWGNGNQWNNWNSMGNFGWNNPWNTWGNGWGSRFSLGLGWGSRFNNFGWNDPWGMNGWNSFGWNDPFNMGGWGMNGMNGWGNGWGFDPWNSWGNPRRVIINNNYFNNPANSAIVVAPGTTGGSNYSRPRDNNYGRSQSAYNGDFNRGNASAGSTRGGRTDGNSNYYTRPARSGNETYTNGDTNNTPRSNGRVNSDNSYSRGSRSSSSTPSSSTPSYSSPSSGSSSGGGGGGRSRGPR